MSATVGTDAPIARGMIGGDGAILPLAGRTGAEIDALTRVAATKAAGLAKWTNEEGWLLSPNEDTASR